MGLGDIRDGRPINGHDELVFGGTQVFADGSIRVAFSIERKFSRYDVCGRMYEQKCSVGSQSE